MFTGADHGIQGEVEQDYQWGFSLEDILRDDVLLAYEMNGQPLPPQHGFPIRLLVPGLVRDVQREMAPYDHGRRRAVRRLPALGLPAAGRSPMDPVSAVTRKAVRALMLRPGFSDFPARQRFVDAGPIELTGRAWSGWGHIARVEVSIDGGDRGRTRSSARSPAASSSWRSWSFGWNAEPGEHELLVRATDDAGNVQPTDPPWNYCGFMNNTTQRVPVTVR